MLAKTILVKNREKISKITLLENEALKGKGNKMESKREISEVPIASKFCPRCGINLEEKTK